MADPFAAYPLAPTGTPGAPPPGSAPQAAIAAPGDAQDPFAAYPLAPNQPAQPGQPREASGPLEALQAGYQASATGLALRGRMADIVLNPEHSAWWERALSGIAQVGSELPIMAAGGAAGTAGGAAAGAVVGPAGAAVGGVLGGGAGMFALPTAIRETLMAAYRSGEVKTGADFWNEVRQVATATVRDAAIGAATLGAGGMAARTVGRAIAPAIGESLTVPAATRIIGSVDTAAQIAAMTAMPAALQGHLPDWQEFVDGAIIVGGLHVAGIPAAKIANRMANVFSRTGKTPAEQVADAQKDPAVARDLAEGPEADTAAAYTPPRREDMLTIQESLFRETARMNELEARAAPEPGQAAPTPLTAAEQQELPMLRARVAELEAQMRTGPEGAAPIAPRYGVDQLAEAKTKAQERLTELTKAAETGNLTDAERAERVYLTNSAQNTESLARHFGLEPQKPAVLTAEAVDASAQRVHDDVLRQVREADAAREAAGQPPLGDDHAQAVAALVRARVRTRAARLGVLPEEIYRERPIQIQGEGGKPRQNAEIEALVPEISDTTPDLDLFGNPVEAAPPPPEPHSVEARATVEVPLAKLTLSKDVPQFKGGANREGVVEPLGGAFDRTGVGPIQVWERLNGDLEVVSGRHRLDLARRSNEETIPAQIHREADGFDARQAAILDAQLNIREGQGSVADFAQFFKDAGISRDAAEQRGLLAREKGRAGFAIARDASPDLLAAHRAGRLTDQAAVAISSAAPGSARLQALGINAVNDGKSILFAVNTMRAVDLMASERMAAGTQGDIFGFDDSAMVQAAAMAKKASSKQRQISEQIAAVNGASKRPELARKMGVDVQDPEGIQKRIAELKAEQVLWDNWPLHPELVAKLRDASKPPEPDKMPALETPQSPPSPYTEEVQARLDELKAGYDRSVALIKNMPGLDAQERGKRLKGVGMRYAAEQRQITGELTTKEAAAAAEREAGNYIGKEVLVDGFPAVVTANPFGRVSVRFADGVAKTVDADQVTPMNPGKPDPDVLNQQEFPLRAETPAEARARDREAAAQAHRREGEDVQAVRPLYQSDSTHRGSYDIAQNLVTIMAGADKSTVVHELGHSWLEEMKADAARKDAPADIRTDWETLRRELAIGADGEISRASHEQFARSVERYLADGVAPSRELQPVFARFKEWLLDIYRDLRGLNVEINPDLRAVLDRMLATDAEIADARRLDVPREYVPAARTSEAEKIVPAPEAQAARRKIEPGFAAEQHSMQPFADEIPPGPGEAPDNIHVNYKYINGPDDLKLAMQRMAEIDQANIQKERGPAGGEGVKSWEEANDEQARYLNDILGGSADTLHLFEPVDPSAPRVDARLGILKKLAVGAAKDSARLRDVVLEAGHDATVRQQLEYMGSIERARMIQAEFLGERAGVARALNALKDTTEGTGEIGRMLEAIGLGTDGTLFQAARTAAEEQAYLKAKLDEILQNYKGKTVLDIARLHKEIGTLKGSFKFAEEVTKATKWQMVVEGWRAGLLSGPVTHTTNLFGTASFLYLRPAVDALAAVIGTARGASPGMGESDRATMSMALARLTGMTGAVGEGLRVGYHTFRADEATSKTESYRTAIPGRAGEIIRIPLRLMGATDAMLQTMYGRSELAVQAMLTAFNEGLNPATREFAARVDALKDNPTPEIQVASESASRRMAFNSPPGEKTLALMGFVNKWNLQWMVPFINTPINIFQESLRLSPFAPAVTEWRQAIAKGSIERDRALAEMALGSGIMALTVAMAFGGQITGSAGPDPGKNRGKAGVEQPGSWLIGDTWHEYTRIQPIGTLMNFAADMAQVWDHMNDEEKDKIPKMLANAFAQAVTNQTFLQGITNVVNAMSDPTRFGPRFFQQLAGSAVPNIIGQPTTMADPTVRQVNSALEAVMARVPGLRQELEVKRDWLGEPEETRQRLGVILPSRTLQVSEDKVRTEAARLDLSLAGPPKKMHLGKGTGKIGDVELTPHEQNEFARVAGEMAHKILANVVAAPGYDAIPDLVKRKIFTNILTASHRVAAVQALPADKRVAYLQEISEKITTALQPGDNP